MGDSPNSNIGSGRTTVEISVDGTAFESSVSVLSVEVVKEMNKIPYARIVVKDGDAREQNYPLSESGYDPGKEVEIKVGHDPTGTLETIFKGIIVEHGIKQSFGVGSMVLVCKDEALKLTVGRKNMVFYEMTDSDIISQVVSDAGLSADVESTSATHKKLVQYYSTNWDFIQARADANGLVTIINDGEISIKKPTVSEKSDIAVAFGTDVIDINLRMDATHQYSAVVANCWNHADQAVDNAEGAAPSANAQGDIDSSTMSSILEPEELVQTSAPVTADVLQAWTDSVYQRGHLSRIRGTVSFMGTVGVEVGKTIELASMGAHFDGDGYITKVRHTIKDSQWKTEVGLGMPPKPHLEAYPQVRTLGAGGGLPPIHGLQHGVVKQIHEDPDGEFRVLVNIPIIDNLEGDGLWARMGHLYATEECGFSFWPEVGDEVILGFFDNDPAYPVILGTMYSSARVPFGDHEPGDPNQFKGISLQKGKMKLEFDDEDCIIKIITPNEHLIQISDSDDTILIEDPKNSNSMLFDSAGITMESQGDITLKATGNVVIEATGDLEAKGMNVTMESTANFDIKGGAQLNAEAPMFEIKGSGMGTVDGGGMLTVKGGMVMIN